MSAEKIIDEWLVETESLLIKNYDRLKLRASGKWAESLDSFNNRDNVGFKAGILGADYTQFIENGRGPNQNQGEEAIRKWVGWAGSTFIKKWVEDKGLDISPFAVAYKIARKGWEVPNKHNAGGLVSDVINSKRIDELNKKLALFYIDGVKSDIIKTLKR